MPRVPTVRVVPGLRPVVPRISPETTALAGATEVAGELTQVLSQEWVQERRRERVRELTRSELATTRALNALEEESFSRDDFDPEALTARAEQAITESVAGISDDSVREQATLRAQAMLETFRTGLARRKLKIEREADRQGLTNALEADAKRFGLAEDGRGRTLVLRNGITKIRLAVESGILTPEDGEALEMRFREGAAQAYARRLNLQAPEQLREALRDPEHPILSQLDPIVREQMAASAEVEIRRRETLREQALVEARRLQANGFLDRIFTDPHPEGMPKLEEILDSDLSVAMKEHFIGLVQKKVAGEEADFSDARLTNDLWRRVHDPSHPERITTPEALLPHLGKGLLRTDYDKLEADLQKLQSTKTKALNEALNDFFEMAEAQITESNFFSKDAEGDKLFYEFRLEFLEAFDKAVAEGKNPLNLLNPRSRDYLGGMIESKRRGPLERARDMRRELERSRGSQGPLFDAVPSEARRPGESIEDWAARVKAR